MKADANLIEGGCIMNSKGVSSLKDITDSTRVLVENVETEIKTMVDTTKTRENVVTLGKSTTFYARYEMD